MSLIVLALPAPRVHLPSLGTTSSHHNAWLLIFVTWGLGIRLKSSILPGKHFANWGALSPPPQPWSWSLLTPLRHCFAWPRLIWKLFSPGGTRKEEGAGFLLKQRMFYICEWVSLFRRLIKINKYKWCFLPYQIPFWVIKNFLLKNQSAECPQDQGHLAQETTDYKTLIPLAPTQCLSTEHLLLCP